MKIFTDKFNKLIKQMVESGHKNITIHLHPEYNYFDLVSEWNLKKKTKKIKGCKFEK